LPEDGHLSTTARAAMPIIQVTTHIRASPSICFDLARDVEMHTRSTSQTGERAIGGITTGRLSLGDTVTWEAIHLGIRQRLTAQITRFEV
jgi:hypothetical protein